MDVPVLQVVEDGVVEQNSILTATQKKRKKKKKKKKTASESIFITTKAKGSRYKDKGRREKETEHK